MADAKCACSVATSVADRSWEARVSEERPLPALQASYLHDMAAISACFSHASLKGDEWGTIVQGGTA